MAAAGLTSYRYKGWLGWAMIGATDTADALREAARSVTGGVDLARCRCGMVALTVRWRPVNDLARGGSAICLNDHPATGVLQRLGLLVVLRTPVTYHASSCIPSKEFFP